MYVSAWDELPPLCCAIARTRVPSERHIRSPMRRMETSYMEKSIAALQTRCSLQIPDGTTAPLQVKHEVQRHHIDWKEHARTDLGFRETALGNSSYTSETITINKTIFPHHQTSLQYLRASLRKVELLYLNGDMVLPDYYV